MAYDVIKSTLPTKDGKYIYNLEGIPQGYVKICNLFSDNDAAIVKQVRRITGDKKATVNIVQLPL